MIKVTSVNPNLKLEYTPLLNKAFEYIENNIVEKISLDDVARNAHYSPYHFHRIFKLLTGETINNYINRRRLETSANLLIRNNSISLTDISIQTGFNSLSTFSRSFKKHYQVSPSKFRELSPGRFSKISQTNGKISQVENIFEKYICNINKLIEWMSTNASIKIENLPAYHAAAINHVGIQGLENTFGRLINWSNPYSLMSNPKTRLGRIFYDSIKITAPDKVRMAVCMITEKVVEVTNEVISTSTDAGRYIVARYEILPTEFEKAWSGLFIWMNENGYSKSASHPFEIYHNDPRQHPEGIYIVDLHIPIK